MKPVKKMMFAALLLLTSASTVMAEDASQSKPIKPLGEQLEQASTSKELSYLSALGDSATNTLLIVLITNHQKHAQANEFYLSQILIEQIKTNHLLTEQVHQAKLSNERIMALSAKDHHLHQEGIKR